MKGGPLGREPTVWTTVPSEEPTDLARIFHDAIQKLEKRKTNDADWGRMAFMIGVAWQRYELSDADAEALESYIRLLRFPRR